MRGLPRVEALAALAAAALRGGRALAALAATAARLVDAGRGGRPAIRQRRRQFLFLGLLKTWIGSFGSGFSSGGWGGSSLLLGFWSALLQLWIAVIPSPITRIIHLSIRDNSLHFWVRVFMIEHGNQTTQVITNMEEFKRA